MARVDRILKKGLVGEVATQLRGRMERGELTGLLPGVRLLSKALGVSVPTICRALHQLEAEGDLQGGGQRKRWQVPEDRAYPAKPKSAGSPRPGGKTKRTGRLLFLASQPLSSERHSGVEVFSELLDQLSATGWEMIHRVVNFGSATTPRMSWDKLLKLSKPDAIVTLGGTPALGGWLREKQVRALFIGGDPGDSRVPVLAVRVTTMLRYALERLLSLGHRRILVPLCGRGSGIVARCNEVAAETTTTFKRPREDVVIAETAYARPEVTVDLLRRQWRTQPPDALILLDWREFLAASGFFREAGIEIPRDLSVVILSQNSIMDWHLPKITHFEHPVKLMARSISKWVTQGRPFYDPEPVMEVRARWVEGQSVIERK